MSNCDRCERPPSNLARAELTGSATVEPKAANSLSRHPHVFHGRGWTAAGGVAGAFRWICATLAEDPANRVDSGLIHDHNSGHGQGQCVRGQSPVIGVPRSCRPWRTHHRVPSQPARGGTAGDPTGADRAPTSRTASGSPGVPGPTRLLRTALRTGACRVGRQWRLGTAGFAGAAGAPSLAAHPRQAREGGTR
jgi:hypothetical protein